MLELKIQPADKTTADIFKGVKFGAMPTCFMGQYLYKLRFKRSMLERIADLLPTEMFNKLRMKASTQDCYILLFMGNHEEFCILMDQVETAKLARLVENMSLAQRDKMRVMLHTMR